jgi:tRNA 2-thiouridine synthesizing protein A
VIEAISGSFRGSVERRFSSSATLGPSSLLLAVDDGHASRHGWRMTTTRLDLAGLKCPLPALKTRKALKSVKPGDLLEVHCTDPLSVIDIPNLIRETGDRVEITEHTEARIIFLIEKVESTDAAVRS